MDRKYMLGLQLLWVFSFYLDAHIARTDWYWLGPRMRAGSVNFNPRGDALVALASRRLLLWVLLLAAVQGRFHPFTTSLRSARVFCKFELWLLLRAAVYGREKPFTTSLRRLPLPGSSTESSASNSSSDNSPSGARAPSTRTASRGAPEKSSSSR